MTVPIRAVNLTAASLDLPDILEAIRVDIENNSTWSVVHDYGVALNDSVTHALTFASATPDTITSAGDDWTALGIGPGDQIDVDGSTSNDGRHTVAAISGGSNEVIELTTSLSLTAEGPSTGITVSKVGGASLGSGRFSMAIRSPSGGLEINFFCSGTIAAPTNTAYRVGVNPDGGPGANAITDSRDPSASSANYSGTDGGKYLPMASIGNTEFIYMEWSDAIMVLFKDASRLTTPRGIHAGNILINPLASLANPGGASKIRMDGHAVFGSYPGYIGTDTSRNGWLANSTTYTNQVRRRVGLGNSVSSSGTLGVGVAWHEALFMTRWVGGTGSQYWQYGPDAEYVPQPLMFTSSSASYGSQCWVAKYVRLIPPFLPRFGVFKSGGVDAYMSIGYWATVGNLYSHPGVPIPDGFNPNP